MEKSANFKSKQNWGKLKQILLHKKPVNFEKQTYLEIFEKQNISPEIVDWIFQYENFQHSISIIQEQNEISVEDFTNSQQEKVDLTGLQVWPAEEILSYYLLKNFQFLQNKKHIIELGAGYSGIASLILCYLINQQIELNKLDKDGWLIHITDGNSKCATHLQKNLELNLNKLNQFQASSLQENNNQILCSQLIWDKNGDYDKIYDLVLISDCLFFRDFHLDLCETLKKLLKDGGIVIIVGPKRGGTSEEFFQIASKDFKIEEVEFKDEIYEEKLIKMRQQQSFDVDKNLMHFYQMSRLQI